MRYKREYGIGFTGMGLGMLAVASSLYWAPWMPFTAIGSATLGTGFGLLVYDRYRRLAGRPGNTRA